MKRRVITFPSARLSIALSMVLLATGVGQSIADDSPEGNDGVVERADALNDEGKILFSKGELDAAASKFRAALALSPQGRYYFNLCFLLNAQGELDGALGACSEVDGALGADDRLRTRTEQLTASIEKKRAKRNPGTAKPSPYPGTEPDPGPNPNTPPAVGNGAPPRVTPAAQPVPRPRRYAVPVGRPRVVVKKGPPPPAKKFHVGIVGGFSFSNYSTDSSETRPGYMIGAFMASPFSKYFAGVAEVAYTQRGGTVRDLAGNDFKIDLNYVSAAGLGKLLMPLGDTSKLHVEAGLAFNILASSTREAEAGFNDPPIPSDAIAEPASVDIATIFGGGITFHRRGSSVWMLDLRYETGLLEVERTFGFKTKAFSLLFGYAW